MASFVYSVWHTVVCWLPHMCTQAAFDLFGQVKDVRRFWIPDILWILQPLFYKWDCLNSTPTAECIAGHIQTECSLSSRDVPVLCMWGFAHVCSLRNAVLFFTRHLRLLLWGIFPECFSYSYEEPNMSCFLDYGERPCLVVKYACLSHPWGKKRIWLCDIMTVFPQRKVCHLDREKLCTPVSCKNISTCRKNFRGSNLASWFKLEASCMKRGRPLHHFSVIFARNIPRDPLWRNTT